MIKNSYITVIQTHNHLRSRNTWLYKYEAMIKSNKKNHFSFCTSSFWLKKGNHFFPPYFLSRSQKKREESCLPFVCNTYKKWSISSLLPDFKNKNLHQQRTWSFAPPIHERVKGYSQRSRSRHIIFLIHRVVSLCLIEAIRLLCSQQA